MPGDADPSPAAAVSSDSLREKLCDAFESEYRANQQPRIESYLSRGEAMQGLLAELVALDCFWRRRRGETPRLDDYLSRFGAHAAEVRQGFACGASASTAASRPSTTPLLNGAPATARPHRTLHAPQPFGAYLLLDELGQGGMGAVYAARQKGTERMVALKLIRRELLLSEQADRRAEVLDRFRHEARAAACLQHDHIVTVYEVGDVAGQPYYSMQLVEGSSLAQLLQAGPLPQRRAARYLEAVARAVHHAHLRGILHRDLKPANVLVEQGTDRAKVTDFGLAKFVAGDNQLTHSGQVLGTPAYMSPEQARGGEGVTSLSDVYSLGATLYHVLAGRPVFVADSAPELLYQLLEREPLPPSHWHRDIAPDLDTICRKCLAKVPAQRYASAQELADDLAAFLEQRPIQARPASSWERAIEWARRRPAAASLLAVSLVAPLLLLALFALFNWRLSSALARAQTSEAQARQGQRALLVQQQRLQLALYRQGISLANQHLLAHRLEAATRALQDCPEELRDWQWQLLWAWAQGQLTEFDEDLGLASDLAYSPQGTWLAGAGHDGLVRIWDAQEGQLLHTLGGHEREVLALDFSPDESVIASAAATTVRLWDVRQGKVLRQLDHGHALVTAVAYHPQGEWIATYSVAPQTGEADLQLWNPQDGQKQKSLGSHGPRTAAVLAFSRDGQHLASGCHNDGTVKVWEIASGELLTTSTAYAAPITDLAFSADGPSLIVAGQAGAAILDPRSGAIKTWLPPQGPRESVESVSLTAGGAGVALATLGGDIHLFRIEDGTLRHSIRGAGRKVACHPHTNRLAIVSPEGRVKLWRDDGRQRERVIHAPGTIADLDLSSQPQQMVIGTLDGRLLWYNLDDAKLRRQIQAHPQQLREISLTPAATLLATRGDGPVKIWHAATGEFQHDVVDSAGVSALAWEARQAWLALGTHRGQVMLWDPHARRVRQQWQAHDAVNALAVTPQGDRVASSGFDHRLHLWTLEGQRLWSFPPGATPDAPVSGPLIHLLAYAPDGQLLAGAGRDRVVRLWRAQDGHLLRTIRGTHPVLRMNFTPAGDVLITVELRDFRVERSQVVLQEGVVRLWQVSNGSQLLALPTTAGFGPLSFSKEMDQLGTYVGAQAHLWHLAGPAGGHSSLRTPGAK